MEKNKKIIFVCLGNICRSPMAEGMMKHLISEMNLTSQFHVESAGTGAYHIGNLPDNRMRATAIKYGIDLNSKAQQFKKHHFSDFDYIIAMDESNKQSILSLTNDSEMIRKVYKMRDFDEKEFLGNDVPDPYYGSETGFENVFQIVKNCCENLLKYTLSQTK